MGRKRILFADDHEEMRAIIRKCLQAEFDVVGAVEDGKRLLEAESSLKPDVCLLDLSMPGLNGIETTIQLKARGSACKIVFLTIIEDLDYVEAALRIGASGYVIKCKLFSDLLIAIKEALAGRTYISPSISAQRFRQLASSV